MQDKTLPRKLASKRPGYLPEGPTPPPPPTARRTRRLSSLEAAENLQPNYFSRVAETVKEAIPEFTNPEEEEFLVVVQGQVQVAQEVRVDIHADGSFSEEEDSSTSPVRTTRKTQELSQ